VNVSGILVQKTFPGPPDYQDLKSGDRPENYWLIELHSPVCVSEDRANPELNPSKDRVAEMQLVFPPTASQANRSLIGRNVIISGTLFGAHTGHHHTPVLLTVKSIMGVKQRRPAEAR